MCYSHIAEIQSLSTPGVMSLNLMAITKEIKSANRKRMQC